ncbi:Lrp/AsnC family transcriptional regulator, regulator for asnA, asnC and gidA [Paucidesulfovibrio gracilis DSM 16080]|uniref:Lrp/AsnC family transcriptional regulator, regulator for asnA, asnC and gidA n=1 Tax=Paucidesulfovibrio gracilis DSM 16080 TaxID=1121449 RepID=A0A1T4Y944_9BACT|nr:Lrp/AsnC family transcriptional regulator [Paucidesulfovibrio gracilis]SKA98276.1 Lrp/AsnC family transcriptional regulator, regulator for asnA, asnC and gidA [Paucidesulfovibrio gracilis DSM 16080]
MKKVPDHLDLKIVSAMSEDGQMPAGRVAERLGITAPTVRSRLRGLLSAGMMRVVGVVDPYSMGGMTVALVGVTLQSHSQLGEKMDQIAALDGVSWTAVVTGRYDIIVEVILSEEIGDLYRFLDEDLSSVGGIASSESFVLMKARRKWTYLPKTFRRMFSRGDDAKTAKDERSA